MKRCPQCNRTYSDDSLSLCPTDGATLVAADEQSARAAESAGPTTTTTTAPVTTEVLPAGSMPPTGANPAADAAQGFQAPPPPPFPHKEQPIGPVLSTPETLTGIFFEPGRVFESFRVRPRFLLAGIIIVVVTVIVSLLLLRKVDFETFMHDQLVNSPRGQQMTPEQIDRSVQIGKIIAYVSPPFAMAIYMAAGAALYLLGVMAVGGSISYKKALSVWVYSEFPPAILSSLVALVLLLIKPAESIDLAQPGGGIAVTNLGALLGPGSSPALVTALSALDLFKFYGLFLAALGLRKVARLSSGASWAVVIGLWLIGIVLKVAWAAIFGRAT